MAGRNWLAAASGQAARCGMAGGAGAGAGQGGRGGAGGRALLTDQLNKLPDSIERLACSRQGVPQGWSVLKVQPRPPLAVRLAQ